MQHAHAHVCTYRWRTTYGALERLCDVGTVVPGLRESRTQEGTHRFYRFCTPLRGRTHRFYRVSFYLRHRFVSPHVVRRQGQCAAPLLQHSRRARSDVRRRCHECCHGHHCQRRAASAGRHAHCRNWCPCYCSSDSCGRFCGPLRRCTHCFYPKI